MLASTTKKLTKVEFWALADASDRTYELIDGVAVPKMSPKYFHARAEIEWAFDLRQDFTPVPDLIYEFTR